MKAYKYKIQPKWLDKIKKGEKDTEFRKFDRKYQNINEGDLLILTNTKNEKDFAIVKIIKKMTFFPRDYDKEFVNEELGNDISWNFFDEYYKKEIQEDRVAVAYVIKLVITNE